MVGLHIELNEQSHFARGGHPENLNRLKPIRDWLNSKLDNGHYQPIKTTDHGTSPILRVHSPRYVDHLQQVCRNGAGHLDQDTYVLPTSLEAARRVVDASLSAVDTVMEGKLTAAFLLGRPPGHHAEHDRAMGFCLINNVAVAAQYLLDQHHLERVAVIDFDVHHGNGTQHIFYDRSDVYFISTHQYPFYPGTGAASETGAGTGKGFTLNIPLKAGDGDHELVTAFEQQVIPALRRYRPQFLLVSAGFDAHQLDPLGGMNVTGKGFRAIATLLSSLAQECADGRIVSLLEGGYDPEGNLDSIANYLNGLDIS